jgi:hypothetical protein
VLQFKSDFAYDISWYEIVLTYEEMNCFYFSHLLEKTSDGILTAAKLGDLKMVSGIMKIKYVTVYLLNLCLTSWNASDLPDLFN